MDYQKEYNDLISKARSENRVKDNGVYYEGHHIIPKCMGGKGSSNGWKTHPNIILLTPEEHFWAHVWLIEMYPEHQYSLRWALHRMMNSNNDKTPRNYKIDASLYAELREKHAKMVSQKQIGRTLSKKTVDKIREKAIEKTKEDGYVNPFKGKTHTPEMIEFFRVSQTGEKSAMYGKKRDRDSVEIGASKIRGVPKSEEHKKKLSKSKIGIPSPKRKYTPEQVREIRNMKEKDAIFKYGLSRSTFWKIKSGVAYKEIV